MGNKTYQLLYLLFAFLKQGNTLFDLPCIVIVILLSSIHVNFIINIIMSQFIPSQSTIATAFSISSLGLSFLVSFFHRDFSHSLFIVQMAYLFTNVYASTTSLFASNLGVSWLNFMPSILTYCSGSSYECNNANLITPLIVWVAFIILLWIIIKLVAIKKPDASFKPVYNFFKGALRCTMIPLFYNSMVIFHQNLKEKQYHRDYYAALIVLILYGLIVLIELIGYKCSESASDDSWIKWLQIWNQIKIGCCLMLVSVSYTVNPATKYLLYIPIVFYDIFHLVKYNYNFKVLERVVFLLQQAIFITLYTLFIINASYISSYNLDLIGIAVTILLEILILIVRIYSYCKLKGTIDGYIKNQAVDTPQQPQDRKASISKEKTTIAPVKTKRGANSFIADVNLDDTSFAQLNGSISSPRKGNRGRLV